MLKFAGVKIDNDDFADKVIMPKLKPAREEIPTDEQIRSILNHCNTRVRAFIMLLCDTGLGRGEAIRLRPKDFAFNEDPVRIVTERFKTGEQIETFCTKETAKLIQQIINENDKQDTDYIFVRQIGKRTADMLTEQYRRALHKAELDQKIDDHKYYKFHFHIYRKRWFTKAINVVPAYVAHAMLGRKQYLDQYLAHSLNERRAFYKKITRHVSPFESKADKAEVLAEASEILGVELTEEKLNAMRDLFGKFSKLGKKDFKRMNDMLGENEK